MVAAQLALFISGVVFLSLARADDPIADALKMAKEEYKSAVEKASNRLVAAFIEQQNKLEEDKTLKVDKLIELLEQIQKQKKAFETDPTKLPTSAVMDVAAFEYQTQLDAAKEKCDAAFYKAAEGYRDKKDLITAKALLAEKDKFFKLAIVPRHVADLLPGKWKVSFVGRTKGGSKINYQANWEFDKAGGVRSVEAKASGIWAYDPKTRQVVISWDNAEKSQEWFPVPLTPSGLTGRTWHGAGVKFTAEKVETR